MNYVGRIIVSTTDALEREVIEHYGGKRWRRIMNFLRGIDINDSGLGKKFGEEFVCLRESNVPIHTHEVRRTESGRIALNGKRRIGNQSWMLNKDGNDLNGVKSVDIGYQLSPLEYEEKEQPTIPHDNMPPYREVYIWECVEV